MDHPYPYIAQSCWTLCNPVDCSPPGSSIHGILQARILEWVAISSSREFSQPRDRTQVSHIAGRRFNLWATREAQHGPHLCLTQWNYEPCRVGPLKIDGSWWRVLTKHDQLEKGMANYFSILALRSPWTARKGKKIWHWKMNSPCR